MYLQGFQNTITGYVKVVIEGFYIEKIINICKKNKINLLGLKKAKSTIMYANVPVAEFKQVARIVKENNCKIKIKQKKGLPFIINKYRKRKIFVIALIALIIALITLSKFVWNIEVIGNENISTEEILQIVKEEGLEIGKSKEKLNPNNIVEKIRIREPKISWAGIKICGTNVRIEIVEADLAPKIIDQAEYCNIVATKDAMIEKISAQNGTLTVKNGDIVKKGTVLVAGWLEGKYTGTRYVHATGKVIGKVWYTEKVKIYYKQKIKKQTGNTEKKYSININNFAINFYKKLSKFEIYDTISTEKKLKISSDFYLPLKLVINTNYESVEEEIEYTKDETKEKAINEAKKILESKIGNNEGIVNQYINTNENEEYIEAEVTYEVLEDIGTEEKIAL